MRDTGEANARNEDRNCQTEMHVVFPLAWICAETTICDGLLMQIDQLAKSKANWLILSGAEVEKAEREGVPSLKDIRALAWLTWESRPNIYHLQLVFRDPSALMPSKRRGFSWRSRRTSAGYRTVFLECFTKNVQLISYPVIGVPLALLLYHVLIGARAVVQDARAGRKVEGGDCRMDRLPTDIGQMIGFL